MADFMNSHSYNRHGVVTELAVTERHRLLGALLGYKTNSQVANLVPTFTSYLSALVPERFEGELAIRVQQFFDPTHKHSLQRLFDLAAFFISNNQPTTGQIRNFLQWVIDQNHMTQLDSFLRINTTTTRTFAQRILEATVSMRNIDLLRSLLLSGVDFKPVIREAIKIDDSGFVELLISRVDPECLSGDSGGRLLHSISRTNNVRAAGKLIENGANINFVPYDEHHRRDGTPLYQAVSSREPGMVRLLLDNGADPNIHCYGYIPTAISKAVFTTNPLMEIVDLLLQHGADIKCSVLEQDLLDYVSVKDRDIYRFILDKMGGTVASVTVGDILEAAHRGSRPLSEYLGHHRRSVTQKQLEKALYESINLSSYGISTTLALLEYGVDPNGLTLDDPPLMVAVLADQEKAIRVSQHLINAGASVNIPEFLSYTVEESNFDLLYVLLDAGADLNQYGPEALETAVLREEIEAIALLLDNGTPINAVGKKLSPFQAAASLGRMDLAQYLLDRGADVNTQAWVHGGRTALQAACKSGNCEMVTFLLEHKADINAPPAVSDGITALEAVLSCGAEVAVRAKLFKLLLDNGAEVSCPKRRVGEGILHKIVQQGLKDLLEIALDAGADANKMSSNKGGRTPLQLAAELGRLDIVQMLVARGALVNASPAFQHGRTALQACAEVSRRFRELLSREISRSSNISGVRGRM
jgi:ankyrin repeat protein